MDFFFENWQFLVVLGGFVGGYYDLRNLAKSNKENILEHSKKINEIDKSLIENNNKDLVIRSELNSLNDYKKDSNESREWAMKLLPELQATLLAVRSSLDMVQGDIQELRKEVHELRK